MRCHYLGQRALTHRLAHRFLFGGTRRVVLDRSLASPVARRAVNDFELLTALMLSEHASGWLHGRGCDVRVRIVKVTLRLLLMLHLLHIAIHERQVDLAGHNCCGLELCARLLTR